jgi:hypothetical protein
VPVYRNANIGLTKLQPVVFSHGLSGQRNTYSALFMEMASCGYCVFSISHNDRSADYTPSAGFYDPNVPTYTYDVKRLQVSIRENEVQSLTNEVMKPDFLGTITPDW